MTPDQVAERYPEIAARKAETPAKVTLARAVLAGMFIGMAVMGAHAVGALLGTQGAGKIVVALLFPCGLAMVLIAGGELFTGNCLMVLGVLGKRVSIPRMLKNWGLVYLGNFAGSLLIAALGAYLHREDAAFIAAAAFSAEAKAALPWGEALVSGVLCNFLVCAAVWMSYAAESVPGKIIAMYFPVMLFVLCGLEHCVTNMLYFPVALFLGGAESVTWGGFLFGNLLPVTLGNVIGGAVALGGLLWGSMVRDGRAQAR